MNSKRSKFSNFLINKLINIKSLTLILVTFFIVIRIPYLGFSNFNTDSYKWKQRIYDFGTGVFTLDLEKTNQKYHPGVTLLWVGTFAVKFHTLMFDYVYNSQVSTNSSEYVFSLNFYQILFVAVACAILLGVFYRFLIKIFDPIKSFAILMIFSLEPFFMGLTTTLHLDGILSLLVINTLITFYLYLTKNSKKYLIFSAIFFGLALLTKTTAVLFLPILFISYILHNTKNFREVLKDGLVFVGIFIGIYFFVWPAMWVAPFNTLSYVLKGITVGSDDHLQLYFGNLVSDPGPAFYLLVFIIKTPIYIFPAVLLALYRKLNTTYTKYTFEFFLLMSSILYLIEITFPAKKLDRYILPMMILLSFFALSYLYDALKSKIIYLFIFNFLYVFYLSFDFFSYYNPLVGGLSTNVYAIEPKWAFGQKEITQFFKTEIEENKLELFAENEADVSRVRENNNKLIVAMPEKYFTQLKDYLRYIDSFAVINEIKPDARRASYFLFPVWEDTSSEFKERYSLEYYKTIKVRGVDAYIIYKKVKKTDDTKN